MKPALHSPVLSVSEIRTAISDAEGEGHENLDSTHPHWQASMKRKILLVEDNEMNQDMLSRYLTLFEFDVVVAGNGSRGLEMARTVAPDLILMDMSLPEIDGWQVTRLLKNDEATRSIPIIGLTAHAMFGDKEMALQAGCNEYLTKPINFDLLLSKLNALLETKDANPGPDLPGPTA